MREEITSEVLEATAEFEDNGMYTPHFYKTVLSREEFVSKYIDEAMTIAGCEDCLNYGKVWSCPKHDFSLKDFWEQFSVVELYVVQIMFAPELLAETYSEDEMQMLMSEVIPVETNRLHDYARMMEDQVPESMCFSSGGACSKCKGGCSRTLDQPCRFPEELRYSVESIGINACKAIEELFEFPLLWSMFGKLPEYLTFVNGLLKKG